MVMRRRAGTGVAPASAWTVVCANAGMNFDTGSVSSTRPSSTSIMRPTLVSALLCDAIRKMLSVRIGACCSRSRNPAAAR